MSETQIDSVIADITARLARHKGQSEAEALVKGALFNANLQVRDRYTAQELFDISEGLVKHGGLVELIGRTLRMTALMKGAKLKVSS
ncbi:MAG: hypothetical protein K1X64_10680 [Myxococcaceae bacterium]|nr:hypothetical protein [Myxococcaceae bacterium]